MLKNLLTRPLRGMAIDLGTANSVVYLKGRGIVLDEPSVVALESVNGIQKVLAVGSDAKLMMGKTPGHIQTIRPLRNGVIADLEVAEQMIKHFIRKAQGPRSTRWGRLEVVICVPSGSTSVERRAIRDAASNAGASEVWLIEEPLAAAIGADMPVSQPVGSMVVDIGGGTTEVGVISLRGLAYATSVRVGGDKMDDAITSHIRRFFNLHIGESTAEKVKMEHGTAKMPETGRGAPLKLRGRDVAMGRPREIDLNEADIAEALREPVSAIVQAVRSALENTAPEIAADIVEEGIVMTGGGSLLRRMDVVLAEATGLPVRLAQDPLTCVAIGAGRTLEDPQLRGALYRP